MPYTKYQHVERLGSVEVDGLLFGTVYVFPKIDGTNSQVWSVDSEMHCGSRRRELSIDSDNAGFMSWAITQEGLKSLCEELGEGKHIFGEWLVPHSLKTYREDTWRDFYVFDIYDEETESHIPFDVYEPLVKKHGVNYIPPLRIITNPKLETLQALLAQNQFLIKDGEGDGEGLVFKNYVFKNKFGRQTWGKLTTSQFKEKHAKEMGAPVVSDTKYVEQEIVEEFLDLETIDKVLANISSENDGWSSRLIPKLLGIVWYDFIRENCCDFIKKHKSPTIDFKVLNRFVVMKIKDLKKELF